MANQLYFCNYKERKKNPKRWQNCLKMKLDFGSDSSLVCRWIDDSALCGPRGKK